MDNTYGKQTRAFDKLGCALSGHITYGCCPSRLTALFARPPIQPISLPSFAPQSSPPIVNYQSIIDRARLEEYLGDRITERAVDRIFGDGGGVKGGENDEVNKRGEERGGGWSVERRGENFHRFEFGKRKKEG